MEMQVLKNPNPKPVKVGEIFFGGSQVVPMAGPCAVESRQQVLACAEALHQLGIKVMRGGAFKPRTSPRGFQGLGKAGLELLAEAKARYGLLLISEVIDEDSLRAGAEVLDIIQIGSRNMQNFSLLRKVGRLGKPVLLKRGLAATLQEWLAAAEYILAEGNDQIILCERGIRTFEPATRNTLDLGAVAWLKQEVGFPVVVDPSHASGQRRLVGPLARGAVACGADGLLIEVHPEPEQALCDGQQSLNLEQFSRLLQELEPVVRAVGKSLA